MESVDKIKLLMSYDPSITLNENIENIVGGGELDEQKPLVNAIRAGKTEAELIPIFADIFKTNANGVKLALAKDATTLTKELESAIRKDFNSGVRVSNSNMLGGAAKEASKMKAIGEIRDLSRMKGGKLTEKEIIDIIERTKTQSKEIARKIETRKVSTTTKKTTSDLAKDADGAKIIQKGDGNFVIITKDGSKVDVTAGKAATPSEAAKNLDDTAKALDGDAKTVATENANTVRNIPQRSWDKIKRIRKRLSLKNLFKLGLLAGGGIVLYKLLFGDAPSKNDVEPINTCVTDLMDDDNVDVLATSTGDLVVHVKQTGNAEYDQKNGLYFYPNGRVMMGDKSRKGTWTCNAGVTTVGSIQEQLEFKEVTVAHTLNVNNDVNTMIDLLDFPVTTENLYDAIKIMKKYVGKPEGKVFLDRYKKSGAGPGGIKTSIKFIYAVKPETVEAKEKLMSIVKQIESGSTPTGDGNKSTGIGNISITWDNVGGGSDNQDTPTPVKKDKSPFYHDCSNKDFPFEFGCISPKIYEIQECLGVKPAPQYKTKGYFGPRTRKALIDMRFDVSNGITKEIYDAVMNSCRDRQTTSGDTGNDETTRTDLPKSNEPTSSDNINNDLPPITPPEQPEQPIYNKVRLNELLSSRYIKKVRNGEVIKWKGPELSGNDYYILNKYLTDNGYIQKTQREIGDKDDEDVRMKYKWKFQSKKDEKI